MIEIEQHINSNKFFILSFDYSVFFSTTAACLVKAEMPVREKIKLIELIVFFMLCHNQYSWSNNCYVILPYLGPVIHLNSRQGVGCHLFPFSSQVHQSCLFLNYRPLGKH